MTPRLRFGVAYDFRNPPDSPLSTAALYERVLSQVRLADQLGYDLVWFTEHHFVADGYLPSVVAAAGAVAAVTERVRISTDIALLPFYHPLRLAEDLAVLDNISGGRIELGVGMGYAPHEFAAFGIPVSQRVSYTEEGLELLRLAWGDDDFSYSGRRWQFDRIGVHPKPVQPGGPPLWVAAMSEAGARRAARFDTHLLPQGAREEVLDPWRTELEASGRDPSAYRVGIIRSWLVTDDRERDWPPIRDAERYRMALYADFFAASKDRYTAFSRGHQSIPQTWLVGDADAVAAELASFVDEYGITDVCCWGVPPGVDPERMDHNLERFAREVMPRFR
jgi:alkanesulfonate monooxygenase SsuD/methylene tetrahydromethanopterin reductase-like flavin-dependent oxidoreductase (luciferase family)